MRNKSICYDRLSFCKYDHEEKFEYVGVCHESLCKETNSKKKKDKKKKSSISRLNEGYYVGRSLGDRSKNPDKYIIDANIMIEELETEEREWLRARYTFYIAQSFKDSRREKDGDKLWFMRQAEEWYMKRAMINNQWNEERYISFLTAAEIQKSICNYEKRKIDFSCDERLFKASYLVPDRLEAPLAMMKISNSRKNYFASWRLAKGILETRLPLKSTLFVDTATHNWTFLTTAALSAWKINKKEEAKELWEEILNLPLKKLPPTYDIIKIHRNIRHC